MGGLGVQFKKAAQTCYSVRLFLLERAVVL